MKQRLSNTLLLLLLFSALPRCKGREQEATDHSLVPHAFTNEEGAKHTTRGAEHMVRISKDAIVRSGIRLGKVVASPATGGIEVPAEVQAEPDRLAHISSVVSGQIAEVKVSVGDHVNAGQTLVVIRSVALSKARAQAARARANVAVAKANFRRQQELQSEGIGSKRQFLEARAELRRTQAEQSAAIRALEIYGRGGRGSEIVIRSPIAGRVVSRHATVGEVIDPSEMLFEVTDIKQVWVVGRVYQQHAAQVRENAGAMLVLQSHPNITFSGRLDYVAPSLDPQTRTLPVRMILDNPDGILRPGSFGTMSISLTTGDTKTVPAVRTGALQRLGDKTVVFIPAEEEGAFHPVPVTVLSRTGNLTHIHSGLSVGDRYVSDGAFVLKSELSRSQLGEEHAH